MTILNEIKNVNIEIDDTNSMRLDAPCNVNDDDKNYYLSYIQVIATFHYKNKYYGFCFQASSNYGNGAISIELEVYKDVSSYDELIDVVMSELSIDTEEAEELVDKFFNDFKDTYQIQSLYNEYINENYILQDSNDFDPELVSNILIKK